MREFFFMSRKEKKLEQNVSLDIFMSHQTFFRFCIASFTSLVFLQDIFKSSTEYSCTLVVNNPGQDQNWGHFAKNTEETFTSFFREEEGLERPPQTKMVKKQFPISFTERCSHWLQPKSLKRTDAAKNDCIRSSPSVGARKLEAPERGTLELLCCFPKNPLRFVSHEVAGCCTQANKTHHHFNSFGLTGRFIITAVTLRGLG